MIRIALVASAGPVLSVVMSAGQWLTADIPLTCFHAIYLDVGTFAIISVLGRGNSTAGLQTKAMSEMSDSAHAGSQEAIPRYDLREP